MCKGQIVKQFYSQIQAEQEQFFFSFYRCFNQITWKNGVGQKKNSSSVISECCQDWETVAIVTFIYLQ